MKISMRFAYFFCFMVLMSHAHAKPMHFTPGDAAKASSGRLKGAVNLQDRFRDFRKKVTRFIGCLKNNDCTRKEKLAVYSLAVALIAGLATVAGYGLWPRGPMQKLLQSIKATEKESRRIFKGDEKEIEVTPLMLVIRTGRENAQLVVQVVKEGDVEEAEVLQRLRVIDKSVKDALEKLKQGRTGDQ